MKLWSLGRGRAVSHEVGTFSRMGMGDGGPAMGVKGEIHFVEVANFYGAAQERDGPSGMDRY